MNTMLNELFTKIMYVRIYYMFEKFLLHPPYHPQCEGIVESFNHTLIDILAKLRALDSYQ